jgi:hypothetical protein
MISSIVAKNDGKKIVSPMPAIQSTAKHRRALAHMRKREWNEAHAIVMGMRDKLAFRIHGLVHRIEGDLDNARYWYERAGVNFSRSKSVARELKEIEAALGS